MAKLGTSIWPVLYLLKSATSPSVNYAELSSGPSLNLLPSSLPCETMMIEVFYFW